MPLCCWTLRQVIFFCAYLCAAIPFVGAEAQVTSGSVASRSVDSVLSINLSSSERYFMHRFLLSLSAHTQQMLQKFNPWNVYVVVVDGSTRQVHTNRAEYAAQVSIVTSPKTLGLPINFGDETAARPDFNPGFNPNTGPYRRVYTVGAPPIPHSAQSAPYTTTGFVSTNCNAGLHTIHNGDGPFVYLGGWSTTPNAPYGNVDAGLQYNWKLTSASHDDYSPFMNIFGVGYVKQNVMHIRCHPSSFSFLEFTPDFWNVGNSIWTTKLTLFAAGDGKAIIISWIAPTPPQKPGKLPGGWLELYRTSAKSGLAVGMSCGGCVFKWMTSIGQPDNHPNYHDGATYSATWEMREISCNMTGSCSETPGFVALTNKVIRCSEYPLWRGTYEFGTRDCTNTPANQRGIEKSIDVKNFTASSESVHISLTH